MEEIVTLFMNNGVAVACLIYFMYFNNESMQKFTEQMQHMNENLLLILHTITDTEKET